MSPSPLEKENSFLKKHFGASDYELKALAGDASSRRYFRVSRGGESWVLMSGEPFDPAQFPFISIQKIGPARACMFRKSPRWIPHKACSCKKT